MADKKKPKKKKSSIRARIRRKSIKKNLSAGRGFISL